MFLQMNRWLDSWNSGGFQMYVKLNPESEVQGVAERLYDEIETHTENTTGETLWLQPLEEEYLYNNYENGKVAGGRILYVQIMTGVALLILIISCINFVNLTMARSQRRAKEIGLRKVLGAVKGNISYQFFFESFLYVLLACILSMILVAISLPYINQLIDKDLYYIFSSIDLWLLMLIIMLMTTLFSGLYPSLKLSALQLLQAIQGPGTSAEGKILFRNTLVSVQLGVSFVLIFATLIIHQQLNFMLGMDTGIRKENILAVPITGKLFDQFNTYKSELKTIPGVNFVTGSSSNPIKNYRSTSSAQWEGMDRSQPYEINTLGIHDGFIEHMEVQLLKGKDLDHYSGKNDSTHFLINQAAASMMGFGDDPVGKRLSIWDRPGRIAGLIEDYHFTDFGQAVPPLILFKETDDDVNLALIGLSDKLENVLPEVMALTQRMEPGHSLDYSILDQEYEELFRAEITLSKFSVLFVIVAAIIAALGLIGLSSYQAEKRTKEISIRKIHGASRLHLVMLLYKDFIMLFSISGLIAIPTSMIFLKGWLENFVYHVNFTPVDVGITLVVLLLLGVSTVGVKSYWATNRNPSDHLRYE
jgi:hypothetical protein